MTCQSPFCIWIAQGFFIRLHSVSKQTTMRNVVRILPKSPIPILWFYYCLWSVFWIDASAANNDDHNVSTSTCGLWLAPSTIPGAGWGLYAGRDFQPHETLSLDLTIPFVDLPIQQPKLKFFLWDSYSWMGDSCLMKNEGFVETDCASPGFGAAPNCILALVNVEEGSPIQDSAGLHRSIHAGAGAFTEYHDRPAVAKQAIPAGEELFVDYGDEWFATRGAAYANIPLYNEMQHAGRLFVRFQELKQKIIMNEQGKDDIGTTVEAVGDELWDLFIRHSNFKKSRVFGSFHHDDKDEMQNLQKLNGNLKLLRRQQSTRSIPWLQEHGSCADNITPRPSTLPQAGRGAFSTRQLAKGTLVAQLPMIHIPYRNVLDMWPVEHRQNGKPYANKQGIKRTQLLVNYCLGHPQSTLLLCPYAPFAGFINHNQTLANVRLQWSDPPQSNLWPQMLEMSVEQLQNQTSAVLAMELIALRDIAMGEEIFMDYGNDWEKAWLQHGQEWKPVEGAESYVPAAQLNLNQGPLRTVSEQQSNPYPSNVELHVFEEFLDQEGRLKISRNLREFEQERRQYIINEPMDDMKALQLRQREVIDVTRGSCRVDIVDREETGEGEYLYTVVEHGYEEEVHHRLPRLAFYFFDKPHTTDLFLENGFRHHIGFADDSLFPQAWRNNNNRPDKSRDEKDEL